MHYLNEEHILIFLVEVFLLLTCAKVMGQLGQRWGLPGLVGELFTGILLGPTILGRLMPNVDRALFPADSIQQTMLDTVAWFGVLFLLLTTGFEVSVSTVWKQGKACMKIATVGVFLPFAVGCLAFARLPESYWGPAANQLTFTLFMATAAAISAIPVIAKVLHDLDVLKSDLGLTTLSAFIINDLLGWMIFALVLGMSTDSGAGIHNVLWVLLEITFFGAICLTVGSKLVGSVTRQLHQHEMAGPGIMLTFICCLGVLCGAITQWIGVHAILGFFLAGVMAGNAPEVSEQSRETITQMVHAVFVPIFFASIGIKIDFIRSTDLWLVSIFTVVAIGTKFVGAWLGAVWARLPRAEALSIGIAHIPGGAMEIIVAVLALELGLISERALVAVVFAAMASSVVVGPLFAWSLRRPQRVALHPFLLKAAFELDLGTRSRQQAITELCEKVAASEPSLDAEALAAAVWRREAIMGTSLEHGVAAPHARLAGLTRPIVAFGRSNVGIDWNARDGMPARFVFLILTPEDEAGTQVQILAAIARAMMQPDVVEALVAADGTDHAFEVLTGALA